MKKNNTMKCSKICWDLMELVEMQAQTIKKLSERVRELESLLEVAP